jgi:hypothetical protein
MPAVANLVHELSTTTGTGNLTLANVNGKQSFNDAFSTGGTDAFDYFISSQSAAEWERGTGHLSDATTLVRDTVLESTNSDAAVNFSAGTKDVTNDVPAGDQLVKSGISGGQTITGGTDSGDDLSLSSTSNATKGTIRLGDATVGVFYDEVNGRLTIGDAGNTLTINGVALGVDFGIHNDDNTDVCSVVFRYSDIAGFPACILGARSRGSIASPAIVQDDDALTLLSAFGFDGTDYALAAQIVAEVDGTPGSNDMPTRWVFRVTPDGSQTPVEAFRIQQNLDVLFASGAILTLPNTGLHLLDTNASHDLIIAPGSDLTADRTLTLTTGDADRTLSLPSPTFVNTTLSGYLEGAEISTPSNPAANSLRVYPVDDGGTTKLATLDSAGTETILGSGGGGGGSQDFQRFNASGTWTKPTDAEFGTNSIVLIRAWGAGGSGASASTSSGGGGGGYVSRQMLLSELGSTETVTIGAGGASVSSGTGTGNDGGNTTFGSHVTAYLGAGAVVNPTGGGGGGPLGAASGITPGSPLIVTNTTGPIRLGQGGTSGVAGAPGIDHGGGGGSGAVGGASVNGGGGGGGNNASTAFAGGVSINGGNGGAGGVDGANGTAGTQPGGGGGSAETGGASGAGADGRVDVIVFPVA